ncbi:unnamed protein product [Lota lota]
MRTGSGLSATSEKEKSVPAMSYQEKPVKCGACGNHNNEAEEDLETADAGAGGHFLGGWGPLNTRPLYSSDLSVGMELAVLLAVCCWLSPALDYETLRIVGMVFAVVLFVMGIALIVIRGPLSNPVLWCQFLPRPCRGSTLLGAEGHRYPPTTGPHGSQSLLLWLTYSRQVGD